MATKKRLYTKRAKTWAPEKQTCVFCRRTATFRLVRFLSGTSTVAMNVAVGGAHLKSLVNRKPV